ncbi:hypothetical protein KC326_g1 [Hortaea werneckii]|nr:hypothetical protein KC326_g1 [Hortaea werneckii]
MPRQVPVVSRIGVPRHHGGGDDHVGAVEGAGRGCEDGVGGWGAVSLVREKGRGRYGRHAKGRAWRRRLYFSARGFASEVSSFREGVDFGTALDDVDGLGGEVVGGTRGRVLRCIGGGRGWGCCRRGR